MNEQIEKLEQDWLDDVRRMIKRNALMYHFMAEVLIEQLGEETAAAMLKEIMTRMGQHIGAEIRNQVDTAGYPVDMESFRSVQNLPSKGWRKTTYQAERDHLEYSVDFCPFAEVWKEMHTPLARVYCNVDQGKYSGFDQSFRCTHTENVLDGDNRCFLVIDRDTNGKEGRE